MLKYLRIAVTALSLTACVLLIALWVRSYSWKDDVSLFLVKDTAGVSQMLILRSWSNVVVSILVLITGQFPTDRVFPLNTRPTTRRMRSIHQF